MFNNKNEEVKKMEYEYRSKILDGLGVRSWINAKNWSTTVGGNWIDDRVLEAMQEVAKTFVDMHELYAKADERIAALCNSEDAHITTGAGAAIELAVAGCMAGNDLGKWLNLPKTEGMRNEVALHRGHYIAYTPQWMAAGARIVEYGIAGNLKSCKRELDSAITERTCCLAYSFSYNNVPRGTLPFEEVVEIGRRHDIPIVVDAASELPPVENLHTFMERGADIVCFSGGKAIKAPNNTGFMLGSNRGIEIIQAVRNHSFPHHGWARGHKISKEQIVGLVVALEIFINEGNELYQKQMKISEYIQKELKDVKGIHATIIPNDESYHEHPMMPHVPRVLMEWNAEEIGITAQDLDRSLAEKDPPIFLRDVHYFSYYTNKEWRLIDTFFLRSPEEEIIVERIKKAFRHL
jgi:D-glucosaminate-6-phosphate ammonia-lyase